MSAVLVYCKWTLNQDDDDDDDEELIPDVKALKRLYVSMADLCRRPCTQW